jgi:RNA polymerase sigma-70 factor (ECF subfamily)
MARRDLVDRVLNQVRRTTAYLTGGGAEADDLAQLALLQILGSAGSYRGECSLEYWADRIAVRTVMKHIHKMRRRERLSEGMQTPPGIVDDVEGQAETHALRKRLAALLQKISGDRRTAVVLHHVQGYDLAEISEMTGAPVNTVRDRLRVGRAQLRQHILRDPALSEWFERGKQ